MTEVFRPTDPAQAVALPNAVIRYAVRATDADYRTTAVPGSIEYAASSGSITEDGVYTAGATGVATVTAGSGAASGTAQVSVIASPASISIKNGSADVTGKTISVAGPSILLVYMLVLSTVGFIIPSVIMLFAFCQWFHRGAVWKNAVISIAVILVIYYVFKNFLNVPIDFGMFSI